MTDKQKQLILCCFDLMDPADVDGIWGKQTEAATRKFQRGLGITEDGIFGDGTLRAALDRLGSGEPLEAEEEAIEAPATSTYWDHIRYWTREEFRCRCHEYYSEPYCNGFPVEPDQTLVELVDDLRDRAGNKGIRSSGIRCPVHNRKSNGVANSKHLFGKALDFCIEGMPGSRLLALAQADPRTSYAYQITDGNGGLTDFVHVDVA